MLGVLIILQKTCTFLRIRMKDDILWFGSHLQLSLLAQILTTFVVSDSGSQIIALKSYVAYLQFHC
jgi:hypothetical protein